MYSNIWQILLLNKTWWYYNKFDSTKSLGVHYWCVKIPQCGYMEHGLKYITFYVQWTYNTLHSCHNFPAGLRQAARGARICETSLLYCIVSFKNPIEWVNYGIYRCNMILKLGLNHFVSLSRHVNLDEDGTHHIGIWVENVCEWTITTGVPFIINMV